MHALEALQRLIADSAINAGDNGPNWIATVTPLTGPWSERRAIIAATPGALVLSSRGPVWFVDTTASALTQNLAGDDCDDLLILAANPPLTPNQAEAARRILHLVLAGPGGLTLMGPVPAGAVVDLTSYRELRLWVSRCCHQLLKSYMLPTAAEPICIVSRAFVGPNAAAALLDQVDPQTLPQWSVAAPLRITVLESEHGFLLMPKSQVADIAADHDNPVRASLMLEDRFALVLSNQSTAWPHTLLKPKLFNSLAEVAAYCAGSDAEPLAWQRDDPTLRPNP